MPMFAAFRAGASFTPSPVMATTSPPAFYAVMSWSFCSGRTREDVHALDRLHESGTVHGRDLGAGQRPAFGRDSCLPRDGERGSRIVAGDHHDANAGGATLRD